VNAVSASTPLIKGRDTRLDIQGLRALAVLLVVLFHAGLPLQGGFVGVDVFFVISGYVITAMLVRELSGTGGINFRRFYERRIRRLIPVLTLVVLVTLAFTFLLGSPFDNQQSVTAQTAIGAMTMTANAVIFFNSGEYFATPLTNNPLLNTWSLSVEEQFYLVFPALLLGLWLLTKRLRRNWNPIRALTFGLVTVALVSFIFNLQMSFEWFSFRLSDPDWFAFYSSPTRAWEFALGGIAYLAVRTPLSRQVSSMLFFAGLAGIIISGFWINELMVFPGLVVVLPVVSTVAVLIGGVAQPLGSGLLTSRRIVGIGDASYSWYLWHWPMIAFAVMLFPDNEFTKIVAGISSLLVALATSKFIENPIRFSSNMGGYKSWTMLFGSVIAVVSVSAILLVGSHNAWWNGELRSMQNQVSKVHLWLTAGCGTPTPMGSRGPECTWNGGASGDPIYLAGDSLAGALSEAVLGAGKKLGRPIIVGTRGGCPFTGNDVFLEGRFDSECTDFVLQSVDWLANQAPGDVILSSSLGYLVLNFVELGVSSDRNPVSEYGAKRDIYVEGLRSTVARLVGAGHRVHVILPPPGFPLTVMDANAWFPSQCKTFGALMNIAGCGASRLEREVIAETYELFQLLSLEVESTGGSVQDPRLWVCDNDTCSTNTGNMWKYLDGSHLSVDFSADLTPELSEILIN